MSYGWIITRDVLGDEPKAVGVIGPGGIDPMHQARLKMLANGLKHDDRFHPAHPRHKELMLTVDAPRAFRLYDDDGELYYEGLFLGDHESSDAFGPLDDYGTPNAGCTRIDYLYPNGEWRPL